jgi:hypothetical protein
VHLERVRRSPQRGRSRDCQARWRWRRAPLRFVKMCQQACQQCCRVHWTPIYGVLHVVPVCGLLNVVCMSFGRVVECGHAKCA